MCGRYTIRRIDDILLAFGPFLSAPVDGSLFRGRFNVAPSQEVPVICDHTLVAMSWGMIPSWAKDKKFAPINAQAETIAIKPTWRTAFRKQRCLMPADGFYEWKKIDGEKRPYFIHLAGDKPFLFAGLWDRWNGRESCALVTTPPNLLMQNIHNRMPAILGREDAARWIDPATDPTVLTAMLRPYPADQMLAHPVSSRVNNPRNDTPDLVDAVNEDRAAWLT